MRDKWRKFKMDISKIWPEWNIIEKIGEGSYGVVYKAEKNDLGINSYAAIKVISIPGKSEEIDSLSYDKEDIEGTKKYYNEVKEDYVKEIKLMQSLKGAPNIVIIDDYKAVQKEDGIGWDIYIRMELLTSLNKYSSSHSLEENDVIKLGTDICTALEFCHRQGIIHRDIKPENIFIDDFGNYKLGDFGIARKLETASSSLVQKGPWLYMAPELVKNNPPDAMTDIYSLGLVLYRFMNYKNWIPFIKSTEEMYSPSAINTAVEMRNKGAFLPPPSLASAETANVILRACAYYRDVRFKTAADMKNALLAVQNNTYIMFDIEEASKAVAEAEGTTLPVPSSPPKKKKSKAVVFIIVIALLAAVGGVGVFLMNHSESAESSGTSSTVISEVSAVVSESEEPVSEQNDDILEQVSSLAKDEKYSEAIKLLRENSRIADNEDIYKLYCYEYKKQLFVEVSNMAADNDYIGAVNKLKESSSVLTNDEDIIAKQNEYQTLYVSDMIEQAESWLKLKNFEDAKKVINDALKNFPDNTELIAENEKIQSEMKKTEQESSQESSETSKEESSKNQPENSQKPENSESDLSEPSGTVKLGTNTVKDNDNNNVSENAQKITLGDTIDGSIAPEGDIDFYAFNITQSGCVTLNIKSYMKYYCIYIYDVAGTEVWYTTENEYNSTVGFRQDEYKIYLEKGNYSIKVTGYRVNDWDASTGKYQLKTFFESVKANEKEKNNTANEANRIHLGETINGLIAMNDAMDFYKFTIANSGKVSLDITAYMRYYTISLYDMEGTLLYDVYDKEFNSTVGFRNDKYDIYLEKGSYYIKITGYRQNDWDASTGKYTIVTSYTNANATETEPNNIAEQANEIKFNAEVVGLIGCNDVLDFYKFNMDKSGSLNIDITSYMRYYTLYIYDTKGNEMWNSYDNEYNNTTGFRTDTHQVDLAKGSYYLRVTGYRQNDWDASTGTYKFKLS